MPNKTAEFSTEYLDSSKMRELLLALPNTLKELLGDCSFTCYYGWGTNLHTALQYVPMKVSSEYLPYFIADSLQPQIVVPGSSDLLIDAPDDKLSIMWCHEQDIHVDGKDFDAMREFTQHSIFEGIRWFRKEELAT